MSQYYFLVASLPFLSLESEQAMDPADFLEMARGHLSAADLSILESMRLDSPRLTMDDSVAARFSTFDYGLRNELANLRAAARGQDSSDHVRLDEAGNDFTDESGVTDAAREAVAADSPLAAEHVLNAARWGCLDELEIGHFFDSERVLIYYLKLQILARNRLFEREGGETAFRAATEQIMNDYYQEQGV